MNPAVSLLDIVSTLGFLAASFYALRLPSKRVSVVPKLFFSVCMLLYVLVGISNVLEHAGVSDYMERHYEDYLEMLALPFFLFFLYSLSIWREMEVRKGTEERLAYSEKFLRSIIEAEPECVKLMTADGVLLSMNKAGLEMIEAKSADQVVGKPLSGVVAPEHLAALKGFMGRVLAGGQETLKFKIVGLRGAERWMESHAVPFRDEIENRTLILAVTRDITERVKAEHALRESEQRYRNLFSSIRDVIVVADSGRTIVDANQPALRQLFGYELDEVLGKKSRMLYADEEGFELTGREIFDKKEAAEVRLLDITFRRKNGETFRGELLALKLLDEEGRPVGNFGVIRDVTERLEAEERIRASLREKEILLREIHHRVKNNMQIISSLLNLQARQAGSHADNEMFRDSQNRIRTMALVHEELYGSADLSHILFGDYVSRLTGNLRASYGARSNIAFDLQVPPITIGIETAIPLGLVINELVSNCLKHAFPGGRGGTVSISVAPADGELELTVADDGVGLPEGYDLRTAKTMGHQLVVNLVEHQLKGSVRVRREGGTAFVIRCSQAGCRRI